MFGGSVCGESGRKQLHTLACVVKPAIKWSKHLY